MTSIDVDMEGLCVEELLQMHTSMQLDYLQTLSASPCSGAKQQYWKLQNKVCELRHEEVQAQEGHARAFYAAKAPTAENLAVAEEIAESFFTVKASLCSWMKLSASQATKFDPPSAAAIHTLFAQSMAVDPESESSSLDLDSVRTLNHSGRRRNQMVLMRRDMMETYNWGANESGYIWDPFLARYVGSNDISVAELLPLSSANYTQAIFDKHINLTLADNGIFCEDRIKTALDCGAITLVPHVPMEQFPRLGVQVPVDKRELEEWHRMDVKEYRIWVLRPDLDEVNSDFEFPNDNCDPFTLGMLHGQRLKFVDGCRPEPEAVWWMHMNSIFRASQLQRSNTVLREIQNSTRCWATGGKYAKPGMLRPFLETMGGYLDGLTQEGVLEHEQPGYLGQDDATLTALLCCELTKFALPDAL